MPEPEVQTFTAGDYNNRGTRYGSLVHHQPAIENYNQAIRLAPNYAQAYSNRGTRYGSLGHHQRAIEKYNRPCFVKIDK